MSTLRCVTCDQWIVRSRSLMLRYAQPTVKLRDIEALRTNGQGTESSPDRMHNVEALSNPLLDILQNSLTQALYRPTTLSVAADILKETSTWNVLEKALLLSSVRQEIQQRTDRQQVEQLAEAEEIAGILLSIFGSGLDDAVEVHLAMAPATPTSAPTSNTADAEEHVREAERQDRDGSDPGADSALETIQQQLAGKEADKRSDDSWDVTRYERDPEAIISSLARDNERLMRQVIELTDLLEAGRRQIIKVLILRSAKGHLPLKLAGNRPQGIRPRKGRLTTPSETPASQVCLSPSYYMVHKLIWVTGSIGTTDPFNQPPRRAYAPDSRALA